MKIKIVPLMLLLLALVIILTACASPTPTPTPTTSIPAASPSPLPAASVTQTSLPAAKTSQPSSTPTIVSTSTPTLPSPTENPIHSLGQEEKVQDLAIALIGVEYTPTQLQVTFVAKNTGKAVTSAFFIDFSANAADGTNLKTDACFAPIPNAPPDYAIPSFSGSLQPGENLRGTICWKSGDPKAGPPAPQTGIQVSYTPEGAVKTAGTWDVSKAGKVDAPVALSASDFATPLHAQGELVTLKDIAISFDGVTFQGYGQDKTRVAMTHFTVENKGSSSYKFGEFLSYSFSLKLADGSPLSTDFMTVGCQNSASKVEILPAQKRSITLCFVDPGTSSLAPGSIVIFVPNPDQGDWAIWTTK